MKKVSKKLIIALDGPAGSGKSTTAKLLAETIKVPYIDTGAMYRAATLKAMREGVDLKNTPKLIKTAKAAKIQFKKSASGAQLVYLDGRDVTRDIRLPELTKNVFYVAQEPLIRREMVKKQRALGKKAGAVMEGRDIGTVVFPDADFKFYLDADIRLRAKRRYRDLKALGKRVTLKQVLTDQKRRDATDYNRKEGPLKIAKDALRIDTTSLTIEGTVDKILDIVKSAKSQHG